MKIVHVLKKLPYERNLQAQYYFDCIIRWRYKMPTDPVDVRIIENSQPRQQHFGLKCWRLYF